MNSQNNTGITSSDIKLNVPYFSQYIHVQNADHRPVSCGMTSVYMILKYFGAKAPPLDELIERGIHEGGYSKSGWIHDYFVNLFHEFGYACERRENMDEGDIKDLQSRIKNGNPVIVSVIRRMWDQKDFHMVVLTGIRESSNSDLEGFFYHNPAGMRADDSSHLFVSLPSFYKDWRRMAILPSRDNK